MESLLAPLAELLQPPYSYGLLVISIAFSGAYFFIQVKKSFEEWVRIRRENNPQVDVAALRRKGVMDILVFVSILTAFVSALTYASVTSKEISEKEEAIEKANDQIGEIQLALAERDEELQQQTIVLAQLESASAVRASVEEEAIASIAALEEQIQVVSNEKLMLEAELEERTTLLALAEQEVASYQEALTFAEATSRENETEFAARLETLQRQLESTNREKEEIQGHLARQESAMFALENQLDVLSRERDSLAFELQKLESELSPYRPMTPGVEVLPMMPGVEMLPTTPGAAGLSP